MNSSGVLSSLNRTSALKISEGAVKEMQTAPRLNVKFVRKASVRVWFAFAAWKDTVLVKNELNEFLWAVGERNGGVVGEAATFLGLRY